MINVRNIIIAKLYGAIGQPIIPNTTTQDRPEYPFIDYSITALIGDKSEGNISYSDAEPEPVPEPDNGDDIGFEVGILSEPEPEPEPEEEPIVDIKVTADFQHRISFSFNSYSNDDAESYNLIKEVWNWFKHAGVQTLSYENIAVVDVLDIQNRTVLMVDEYENRYGFDVFIRYGESVERTDLIMEEYYIKQV